MIRPMSDQPDLDAPAADALASDALAADAPAPAEPVGVAVPVYASADRPRGLDAWFAPGGEDDAPPERVADERRMIRLLVLMIALLVGIPTLLTLLAVVAQLATLHGGG
jgi:hypothetical protein